MSNNTEVIVNHYGNYLKDSNHSIFFYIRATDSANYMAAKKVEIKFIYKKKEKEESEVVEKSETEEEIVEPNRTAPSFYSEFRDHEIWVYPEDDL